MTKRYETHSVLIFVLSALLAGILFSSCTQEQVFGDPREGVAEITMDSATAMPLSQNRMTEADTCQSEKLEAAPEYTQDSAGGLDPSTKRCIRIYGPAIKRYSSRYGFDWRLVLAIMKQESEYSRNAESRMGAAGLMQLMPQTSENLTRTLDLEDLSHPEHNIQAGIFYLRKLYNLFEGADENDRLKLTLAAYNAGFSRVHDAQDLALHLNYEPTHWEAVKNALPLLSKRYCNLHKAIWGQDRPKSGWFGNSRETVRYVDAVMVNYDAFRLTLN